MSSNNEDGQAEVDTNAKVAVEVDATGEKCSNGQQDGDNKCTRKDL